MRCRNSTRLTVIGLMFLAALSLSGCGYSHPYAGKVEAGEDFNNKAVALSVEMWGNQTSELGYQTEITQALFRWLKKSPHFTLASSREQADYILTGTVDSLDFPGLSYGTWDRAVELRAQVVFSFSLQERENGTIVLRKKEQRWHESFPASGDAATTEMQKREALREIAEHIAEDMYVQLFYRFSHPQTKMAEQPADPPATSQTGQSGQ
ncbi:MAG: LPS assembly lipoprotein LptE [Thermodesulfobacteriota bacterium]